MKPPLALSILCAALAAVVAYQLYWMPAEPSRPATAGSAPGGGAATPTLDIAYDPKSAFSRVVDANLFSPARTPPEAEATSAPASRDVRAPGLPGFQLKGIMITPEGRAALIELGRKGEYRRVAQGETVDGWTVETIASDSVLVKKEGTSTVVELKAPPPPRKPPAPRRRR